MRVLSTKIRARACAVWRLVHRVSSMKVRTPACIMYEGENTSVCHVWRWKHLSMCQLWSLEHLRVSRMKVRTGISSMKARTSICVNQILRTHTCGIYITCKL